MPFLQDAKNVHISYSDFRDIKGNYVENVSTSRTERGRPGNRTITELGGNHFDFSTSNLPTHDEELMNVVRAALNGNRGPPPTPQPTPNGGNMSRSSPNNTNDDLYIGVPQTGERRDGGHNGQPGMGNVLNSAGSNFTHRVSSSRSGEQPSSVDPAGAQIDFMNGGSTGGALLINNSTVAVAGRSIIRSTVTSRRTQAPISQFSPASGNEDSDASFTGRYRDPTSYTMPRTEAEGGVTLSSMVSRTSASGSRATLDDETSPSKSSTNVPRPEVSINEALKEPPSMKEAGFLGF
ncbi:hypothetical protein APHAL10511_000521 [Amanita phalloides]|nr:hypothetical protein APHAL10511_000521 [Amanita phalloides]